MNELDSASILSRETLATAGGDDDDRTTVGDHHRPAAMSTCFKPPPYMLCWLITVEPLVFFDNIGLTINTSMSTQYIYGVLTAEVGYNGSKASGCSNASLPIDPLEQEVETLSAKWTLYINVAAFSMGLLSVPLLGSWSDVAGRRPVLLLCNLGMTLQTGLFLLVMYLRLQVFYFVVSSIIIGLFGDITILMAMSYSYVADTVDEKSLALRATILEACRGISAMLGSIIGGELLKALGYIITSWFVLVLNLTSILYVYLFIRESVVPKPSAKLFSTDNYKACWQLLSTGGSVGGQGGRFHRRKLWLYMLSQILIAITTSGISSLYVLYELSSPLCWGPDLVGYGSALQNSAYLVSLLALKVLRSCISESSLALIGLMSSISGMVVFSLANTTALIFTGYALSLLYIVPTPVLKSKLSKMVNPSEQGAMFSVLGSFENLLDLASYSIFNNLYPATLHFMKGFSFLFGAAILLFPCGIIGSKCCNNESPHSSLKTNPSDH